MGKIFGTDIWTGISAVLILVSAVFASFLASLYAADRYKGNKRKTAIFFMSISFFTALALLCFFGFSAITVKGIILSLVLVFSSYEDIKARECDDYLHLMIVIAALIGNEASSIPYMLLSGVFAGGLMLLPVLLTKSTVGGADIKMAAACSFLTGLNKGIIGLLAGTVLAVAFNIFKKDKSKGFPMIPYLAVGYMAAYFI
ncbi:MAG: prepilin peptidase [Clostridiales bacterium]|nr:prepilin peptidase [Clostridiales bacterium]